MGDVIDLARHRGVRARRAAAEGVPVPGVPPGEPGERPVFAFDLADPAAYLALERVERRFPTARWTPIAGDAFHGSAEWRSAAAHEGARTAVEARARALRLPLAWPEAPPHGGLAAQRAAALATESDAGAAFAVAAGRLAWCGGYDLDATELLIEAGAAAGLPSDDVLAAAKADARDAALADTARELRVCGADRLPVLVAAGRAFCGEERLAEAVLALGAPAWPGTPVAG